MEGASQYLACRVGYLYSNSTIEWKVVGRKSSRSQNMNEEQFYYRMEGDYLAQSARTQALEQFYYRMEGEWYNPAESLSMLTSSNSTIEWKAKISSSFLVELPTDM